MEPLLPREKCAVRVWQLSRKSWIPGSVTDEAGDGPGMTKRKGCVSGG